MGKEVFCMQYWLEIRTLAGAGLSRRAIARQLRVSRNTVRQVLSGKPSPPQKKPRHLSRLLLPFHGEVLKMAEKGLIGTRILHEIRAQGYTGGMTAFYRFLGEVKQSLPRKREKATVRFETPPGHQAQFDWSPYRVPLGGVLTKVVVFDLIYAYSRRKFYWPSLVETQAAVFEAIERGFAHFGGTCAELLVDNARVFVKDARPEHFEWNPRFLDFCKHYEILPRACPRRRGQTKGKVERPFYYLEQHFIKGNQFLDFEDFARHLAEFGAGLDDQLHHTTKVTPRERFEEERVALGALPPGSFFGAAQLFRKVSWDCMVSFDGSKYSVPFPFAGKEISVKVSQGVFLEIYSGKGERIASHRLAHQKGSVTIEQSHYEGLRKQAPHTLANLKRAFSEEFPEDLLFLEKLLAQYKWNGHHHLRALLELVSLYGKEDLRAALAAAMTYNTFSSSFVRGILERQGRLKEELPLATVVPVPRFKLKRSLAEYGQLLLGEGRVD